MRPCRVTPTEANAAYCLRWMIRVGRCSGGYSRYSGALNNDTGDEYNVHVPRVLIKLIMFPYYWKFKLGGRGVAVGSCLRASVIGVSRIGKLNESVGAK